MFCIVCGGFQAANAKAFGMHQIGHGIHHGIHQNRNTGSDKKLIINRISIWTWNALF